MTDDAGQAEKARRFLELHQPGRPLLLPNPWDRGSARLLAWLGFEALATTSSGFAATLGAWTGR
jgi:2-methylisocitrate lyase-like PEP mutase family enzyme